MKLNISLSIENILKVTIVIAMVYFMLYSRAIGVIIGFFPLCVIAISVEMAMLLYSSKLTFHGACLKALFSCWIVFYIVVLISGLIISVSINTMMSYYIESIGYCAVAIAIIIVSNSLNDYRWFFKTMVVICTIGAVYQLLFGGQYYNTMYVTTLSGTDNPNSLGILMLLGIISSYFFFNTMRKWTELWIIFSFLFLYSIILTGSRKSFIVAMIVMILFFIIYTFNLSKRKGSTIKKIIIFLFLIGFILIGIYYFTSLFLGTSMYKRLIAAMNWESSIRANMYREAIALFLKHPFFGIGFGQYAVVSSFHTYSHSTYAELLSCTGLIGTSVYLIPFIVAICSSIKTIWRKNTGMNYSVVALVGLIGLLILGIGIILPYECEPIIIVMILFSIIDRKSMAMKEISNEINR